MALIVGIPIQALDENGDVMQFAELHTFDADASTTPKVTYSDPDLTVEHPNPVPAGDDGYFPPMYATEGEIFYVAVTPQNGDPDLPFKAYSHAPAIGGDESAVFSKTFADGRYEITSGEVEPGLDGILISAGRSAPENTGGAIKESGWAGTQLDKKIIDAADVEVTGNLSVAGSISRGAIESAVPVALERGVATNVASIIIPLSADFDQYQIHVRNLISAQATAFYLKATLSFDSGASYKTGASDYLVHGSYGASSAGVVAYATANALYLINASNNFGTNGGGADAVVDLWIGASRETRTLTRFMSLPLSSAQAANGLTSAGTNQKAFGRATHIQIFSTTFAGAAANFSFEYTLIGVP